MTRTRRSKSPSSSMVSATLWTAYMTVEWSRSEKNLPISGNEWVVSSRIKYIATCLGCTSSLRRPRPLTASASAPNSFATRTRMSCIVRFSSLGAKTSESAFATVCRLRGTWFIEA